jgi:NAD(P)-dependent dehydrogenase (short-subunit alcohol dehydrogenase family)
MTFSQTIVIAGGTTGIGLATAERLALSGAHLVLIGHNPLHGNAAKSHLGRHAPHADITVHRINLSSLTEIKRLAEVLNRTLARIDVLITNAGSIFTRRELTDDGFERTFALNHMSYFVLTNLLHERLLKSTPSRIINVASEMHRLAEIDFSDPQGICEFD